MNIRLKDLFEKETLIKALDYISHNLEIREQINNETAASLLLKKST